MGVDVVDPANRDHVVFEAGAEVQPGQFDLIAVDVIDAADVAAVRADDFKAFAEQREVYHGAFLTVRDVGKTLRPQGRLHNGGVMGEVVNLNRVRKERARAEAKTAAAANRATHGQSKAERTAADKEKARADRLLDGSKLED